ncbi:hypothetical protein AVEN_84683-1 [Araneus ventricosus]|uniref:Uncharacterized protein n=1 Tax=Araneus ventricosus TaxID=182803 RepID=A0A4Y2WHG8_ARAVE|nr:hypothetical protein AVEN_167576-1 [Araneus ventricosus]GBO36399.1 hypothetical protein AVEN_172003-1 [Araneus ventricosus]GBO36401.1 hypothetical protein AVEN_101718-1 [Araneus ventricosus]GBO36402.1 hypothetical protein AVEN_84683-1 [Araneus ventricosus]
MGFSNLVLIIAGAFPRRALQPRNAKKLLNFEAFLIRNLHWGWKVCRGILSPRITNDKCSSSNGFRPQSQGTVPPFAWLLTQSGTFVYTYGTTCGDMGIKSLDVASNLAIK